ncbi:hydroxyphenylacetyl-CoA thioesterase PaaI [Desulfallas thermosapovorans]|uniref:Acyl-CoA thioesterase n=1 Tax=Desulfallas thermosapovorans DSM 6562 TaxID=1121431 RepID=A0A5S4ZQ06_9FIRM|nr:hydroxyphenylacetyl-CoA thioesterase PaaI [Desulfallas thermosapovorans]TYO94674.1 acyl-CoA thioesterase [Desulfallas thermosapovorans DSM 6562]
MADINLSDEIAVKIKDDPFPNYLGVEIIKVAPGYAKVSLKVQEHMTNIHRITHGGVVFTVADVALGNASNSHGPAAVAMNVNINYMRPSKPGDVLIATAEEVHLGRRTAHYRITVENEQGKLVATVQGLVFRENK